MATKLTFKDFIQKAKEVHGDKYDYSNVSEFTSKKNKVIITCPVHGEFHQIIESHLNGYGCKKCANQLKANKKKLTTITFIERAEEVHGNIYDYSKVEYKDSSTKVTIICPIHGEFEQYPFDHLNSRGCKDCSYERSNIPDTKEIFTNKAKEVHGDKYDYSFVDYKLSKQKVSIFCFEHGMYVIRPNDHLNGHGCPRCSGLWNPNFIKKYRTNLKDNPCALYVIECYSDDEQFIKVGITTKTVEERYNCYNTLNGYQYNTLYEYQSTLIECSEIEQHILHQFKGHQYEPNNKFAGSSECLTHEALGGILALLNQPKS